MSDNIEEAKFEEVVPETNTVEENVSNIGYNSLGMVESDYDDSEREEIGDVDNITKISDEYRKADIEETKMFRNPETGEMVDIKSLPLLDQLKATAMSTGHQLNEPNKSCKKCYGRGYVGVKPEGAPIACDCIFKEYYQANPEAKKTARNFGGTMNRKQKRFNEKLYREHMKQFIETEMKKQSLIQKSKDNLRKNTPVKTEIETAEGVI